MPATRDMETAERDRQQQYERRSKNRVPMACTICRRQHLRCDAVMPTCSRCRAGKKKCVYTTMRRRRKQLEPGEPTIPEPERVDRSNSSQLLASSTINLHYGGIQQCSEANGAFQPVVTSIEDTDIATSRALDSFYTYFHRAHPFVLPRTHIVSYLRPPATTAALLLVMKLIGSRYVQDGESDRYKQQADQTLTQALPQSGFSVQALLLFALALEWSGEDGRAETVLERAKNMALNMGMQHQTFASEHGQSHPVLEESWRRTWWELYIIDALFAGIRHLPTFSLWHVDFNVELPAEEECFISGDIPLPRTLEEYDDRGFEDEETVFSSFTYLIDAARILGIPLAAGDIASGSASSLVKSGEANIMSWDLHLPSCKRDPYSSDGTVDEVLFRAHMVINTVAAHLHRPRSKLHYGTMELLCSKYAPPLPGEVVSQREQNLDRHTFNAIHAAKSFMDLLTLSVPPTTHSPFVMCMGSMATATHMSACEYLLRDSEFTQTKDRVRVFLGILKAFEQIWPQASKWSSEMRLMAKAVFESRTTGRHRYPEGSSVSVDYITGESFSLTAGGLEIPSQNCDIDDFLALTGDLRDPFR